MKTVRLSALRTGRLYPLLLISLRGRVHARTIVRTKGPRDLPACSAEPLPNSPPRTLSSDKKKWCALTAVINLNTLYLWSDFRRYNNTVQIRVRRRSWLRHCAKSRKVEGSIPDGDIGIFSLTQSFRPRYGPGVTQLLTEISTRNIS